MTIVITGIQFAVSLSRAISCSGFLPVFRLLDQLVDIRLRIGHLTIILLSPKVKPLLRQHRLCYNNPMDQALFMWISIIAISILGTLAHFVYEFAHHNRTVGIFAAVNESTWEHIKIALTPTFLWSLLDGAFFGTNENYFLAKITSLLIATFTIPFIFYSYRRIAKRSILAIDISLFFLAIILSQLAFYAILDLPPQGFAVAYISTLATFIFFGAYMTLTLRPLKQIIFKDPLTGKYGFLAHSHKKPKK